MKYYILFGIAIFVGVAGILSVSLLFALTGGEIPYDYGVMIDAGSTHTTFALYNWKGDKDRNTGRAAQVFECDSDPLGGMNPDEVISKLQPCIRNISATIPSEKVSSTEIFLGATAGLRIIDISDPHLSQALIIAARCALQKSSLKVMQVGILSGQDEALFGWTTSNFLNSTLQSESPVPTIGALDLGGASTQVAFAGSVNQSEVTPVKLKLYGREHEVSAISYLCFGIVQVFNRYTAQLVKNLETPDKIWPDPCSPIGLNRSITARTLFGQPCTQTAVYEVYIFTNRHLQNDTIFQFQGTSESDKCADLIKPLLDPLECEKNFTLCFKPIKVDNSQEFLGFSSFYYTTNFVNSTSVDLSEYRKNTKDLCTLNWDEVQALPRKKTPLDVLRRMCFQCHFVDQILTANGYKFDEATWKNIKFVNKVNNMDAGWSLGLMINATNAIPAELPEKPVLGIPAVAILIIICACILVLAIFFLKRIQSRTNVEISYLSV